MGRGKGLHGESGWGNAYTDTQNVRHSTTAVVMVTEEPELSPPTTTIPIVVKLEPQHLAKPGVSAASVVFSERSRKRELRSEIGRTELQAFRMFLRDAPGGFQGESSIACDFSSTKYRCSSFESGS